MLTVDTISYISEKPCAIALGTFDGVHTGHRAVIETAVNAARAEGIIPAVFTFSELPRNIFASPNQRVFPLCSQAQKAALIKGLGVELLITPPFDNSIRSMPAEDFITDILIGNLNARHIVCGYDHRFGANGGGSTDTLVRICGSYGIAVTIIPPVMHEGVKISSTLIRSLVREGRIDDARLLLGHDI